ncbi:peptidoglycan binding protein CsiV [Psychromonas sp. MME2]|uniref:peptidoglycan binding protein CsiV n=1 Tax=unclassified Psychromonas TaxID=2614957 RepID=UPI00339CEFB4
MNYRLILPLILLLHAFPASAEERWFEIELLLFQRNVKLQDVSEHLTNDNINIDLSNSIPLIKTETALDCYETTTCLHVSHPVLIDSTLFDSENNNFQRLTNGQLQLSVEREKLNRHAAYTPVLHLAWRMPVKNRYAAKPIHIFAGENFAQSSADKSNASQELQDSLSNEIAIAVNQEATPPAVDKWAIDGNFTVYLDHFLYIDSQLIIRQQVQQATPTAATQQNQSVEVVSSENDVQIIKQSEAIMPMAMQEVTKLTDVLFDQSRRLRSGEIHYFDHPLMGMIVQIRKIPAQEN